ncbi:MAG: alpha/beta hydrolase [Thermomicrobiales bacterium]
MSNTASASSSRIDVDGGQLHVEQAGAGPDLLMVHSGITDSGMWDGQFNDFATSFHVTRYDMRGYGSSSAIDAAYSHVDDLKHLIEVLQLDQPRVMAASMGARVVLDLALRENRAFNRLLLVGPAVSGYGFDDPALRACWDEMGAAWDAGDMDKAVDIETRFWINGPTRTAEEASEECWSTFAVCSGGSSNCSPTTIPK